MCCSQAWRGCLAGSFSMAAGEYVSMRAQRELFEQQIAMEQQELEMSPKEEEEELSLIYQAKGIPEREAAMLARRIIENPKTAIDTLAREELGFRSHPTRLALERGRQVLLWLSLSAPSSRCSLIYSLPGNWRGSPAHCSVALRCSESGPCFRSLPPRVRC